MLSTKCKKYVLSQRVHVFPSEQVAQFDGQALHVFVAVSS
jgi:hypothetical protein